jgi:hypothetical protein
MVQILLKQSILKTLYVYLNSIVQPWIKIDISSWVYILMCQLCQGAPSF